MTLRIYRSGARAPEGRSRERIEEQLRRARIYRNRLIEIELARRAAVHEAVRSVSPELAHATEEREEYERLLQEAEIRLSRERQHARQRSGVGEEEVSEVRELRKAVRAARKRERALRRGLLDERSDRLQELMRQVGDEDAAERKAARAECDVYWGTYLLVEDAAARFRRGPAPRFRRWDGTGAVGIQIQGGMSWERLTSGADTRVRLERQIGARPWDALYRETGRRRRVRSVIWLRVGTDEDRRPVWAQVPIEVHRPWPDGARLKWVRLHKRRVGCRWRWEVHWVLNLPEPAVVAAPEPACGLDVGWRLMPDGSLRVASWHGSDGASGELRLPARLLERDAKCRDLRSIRDHHLGATIEYLSGWLRGRDLPAELRKRRVSRRTGRALPIGQWRSADRLAAFVATWESNRFSGDKQAFDAAAAWRRKDRHLLDWQEFQRRSVRGCRRDLYRCFVRDLRRRYRSVVIEKLDLRDFARIAPIEEEDESARELRRLRAIAALSELRGYLAQRMDVVEVAAEHTTTTCASCGHRERVDAARHLRVTCSACGETEDQDARAARNLLERRGDSAEKRAK